MEKVQENAKKGIGIHPHDRAYIKELQSLIPFLQSYAVPTIWKTRYRVFEKATMDRDDVDYRKYNEERLRELLGISVDSSDEIKELTRVAERIYRIKLSTASRHLLAQLKSLTSNLPRNMDGNTVAFTKLIMGVLKAEQYLGKCKQLGCIKYKPKAAHNKRIVAINNEIVVLELGKFLIIEGGPGSGKTTFLKRLAISILNKGDKALYIDCAALKKEDEEKSLKDVIRRAALKGTPTGWKLNDSVLLVDGLDEAPFDISKKLELEGEALRNVIVSVRTAFPTVLRNKFPSLELAEFSSEDRDKFFNRWFVNDPIRLEKAKGLINQYRDIDSHTRVPMLATLVAALIENDYSPTSKVEIYNARLRLLLGDWDKVKGVKRTEISPEVKLRFLKQLAFQIHKISRQRRFSKNDVMEIYAECLGWQGYKISLDQMLDELIVAAGVIVEEEGENFSFGHLSFQDHLVGSYLADRIDVRDLENMLGDDWWEEPLKFYASIKGEITSLINYCEELGSTHIHYQQLCDMVKVAPYTSGVAVECLMESERTANYESELELKEDEETASN